jgi:hypothetical protein
LPTAGSSCIIIFAKWDLDLTLSFVSSIIVFVAVFASGVRGPHLCPRLSSSPALLLLSSSFLLCRRLLSLAVYARDKVSLLWNLLRLYLVLASSLSLRVLKISVKLLVRKRYVAFLASAGVSSPRV